jgi:hypothetical protein
MPEPIFHLLFLSVCFFQCVFVLLQWIVNKRTEYRYYLLYLIGCGVYILFRVNWIIQVLPFKQSVFLNEILDKPLIIFAIWMYIRFGYYFLNLKQLQPKVYKAAVRLEIAYITLIILFVVMLPFQLSYKLSSLIFLIATFALAILAAILIIKLLLQKNLLNNFLVSGGLCITLGGATGPIVAMFLPNMGEGQLLIFYFLEIGVFIEMILLNIGFMLKNKILQQQVVKAQQQLISEYQKKEIDKTTTN